MRKQVTHIECPEEWLSTNDWDSHLPLLWLSLKSEPYLSLYEFGIGFGSTPKLKDFFNKKKSHFSSIETNSEWVNKFTDGYCLDDSFPLHGIPLYRHEGHDIWYLGKYSDFTSISKPHLLFIDCAPAEARKELLLNLCDGGHVFIIHDTEEGAEYVYGLKGMLSTFKYRLDYQPEGKPHTTAVSNSIDVTKWM